MGPFSKIERFKNEFEEFQALISDPDEDPEMKALAQEELSTLLSRKAEINQLEDEISVFLLPVPKFDGLDCIMEIGAGAGGEEASIFAYEIYEMEAAFGRMMNFDIEVITLDTVNTNNTKGLKKAVLKFSGPGAYGCMKYEHGGHRVQRIPDTETTGRLHTSMVQVVVCPKYDMDLSKDDLFDKKDCRIDVYRSGGAGGQHVNKRESAVRVVHLPTGIVAESQQERYQHINKEIAFEMLAEKLYAKKIQEQEEEEASIRPLHSSGDRSDRIRTYNFPQRRCTDHRLVGDSRSQEIDSIISGMGLPTMNEQLKQEDIKSQLEQLE